MPSSAFTTNRAQRGLTLIELLVVITIAAVLLGVGVPNLQGLVVNNRLATQSNELHATVQTARSEALRRDATISLRGTVANDPRNWSAGWVMFVDSNRNGVRDAGEELLREHGALPEPVTLYASNSLGGALSFDGYGRAPRSGTLVLCHGPALAEEGQSRARAVVINAAGRVRMGTDPLQDGNIETDTGVITHCTNS